MGLDAVVYKSKKTLCLNQEFADALVVDMTGEVYFEDPAMRRRYPRHTFIAVHKRLGNLAMVAHLREETRCAVGDQAPTVLGKMLYSGVQCGEVISAGDLDRLRNEIALIEEGTRERRSPELQTFLDDAKELIAAARAERNPIVFT
jgi:hypothetical protein